jgi:hypothetical protein
MKVMDIKSMKFDVQVSLCVEVAWILKVIEIFFVTLFKNWNPVHTAYIEKAQCTIKELNSSPHLLMLIINFSNECFLCLCPSMFLNGSSMHR